MSRELSSHDGEADLSLLEISGGNFNKDVFGVAGDLGSVGVDERRERKDFSVGIEKDREFIVTLKNGQEFLHDIICLVEFAKLISGHAFSLLESLELDFSGRDSLVGDRSLDFVQIVSSQRSELASTADVLMKLILEVDEGVV